MSEKDINLDPTPEEQTAEVEAQKKAEAKEEEVRAAVISEYGFDEENDADKIEKAVKKELEHRQEVSKAIGQKVKYRNAAKNAKPADNQKPTPQGLTKEEVDAHVQNGVVNVLEQRDLDSMDYPNDIKEEIKRVADIRKIPVKQAERDPYIVSRIGEYEKQKKADEASISRNNNKGGTGKKQNWSVNTPPEVDMSTPEGRKEYDEWQEWAIKEENKNSTE